VTDSKLRFTLSIVNPDGAMAAELFAVDGTRIADSDNRMSSGNH
jgi:hypothetical protein